MANEGREDVAAEPINEELGLDLGGVAELFGLAGLEDFLEHFDDFLVGEGEAADEELGSEEKDGFETVLGVVRGLKGLVECLGQIFDQDFRYVFIFRVESGCDLA